MKYQYHKDGTAPTGDEIFVFGSNLSGIHGAGAAKAALKFDACWGKGVGHIGQSYALPTKGLKIVTMQLAEVIPYITRFVQYAKDNPELTFFVTRVGYGLAGFTDADIAPLFIGATDNCNFPEEWKEYLE